MFRFHKTILVLLVAIMGVWGCGKVTPVGEAGREANRIKALESKIGKLEDEVRTAVETRDLLRRKLEGNEKERGQYQKQLQAMLQERSQYQKQLQTAFQERQDLRVQIAQRTTERDSIQTQYESFRKEIRSLLGHADAAANAPANQPFSVVVPTNNPNKS